MPSETSLPENSHDWHTDHAKRLLDLLLYGDGQPIVFVERVSRACSICRRCLRKAVEEMGIVERTWTVRGQEVKFWHLAPGPEEMPSCLIV